MAKFSKSASQPRRGSSPIRSTAGRTAVNASGASAYSRDAKSELFLLGVMNFVSEDTFYESGKARDNRFAKLVQQVTREDADWMQRFIPWLRNSANMRSASVVAACEYVRAGGPNGRQVVSSACSRADEPGEVIAYWRSKYGKTEPSSLKRGVGDAMNRLWNEYSTAKYDSARSGMRFADAVQIAHPKPRSDKQAALYKFTMDSRYGATPNLELLPQLKLRAQVNAGEITRDQLLDNPQLLKDAGMTWEALSGLGKMDARAWEAMIPTMNYMALLRNLRNFEQAGISASSVKYVVDFLSDPEKVARSRQMPFRFWSAYKNTHGLQYASAIETALDLSVQNIPSLGGRTLILSDTSGSMDDLVAGKNSTIKRLEAAALFAVALARKGESVDLYGFANWTFKHDIPKGASVLRAMQSFVAREGEAGHGTDIPGAVGQWDGHDRIVLFSDMQTNRYYDRGSLRSTWDARTTTRYAWGQRTGSAVPVKNTQVPAHVPIFGFNLAGYSTTEIGDPGKNEFELGGLTDKTFELLPILERRAKGEWPF